AGTPQAWMVPKKSHHIGVPTRLALNSATQRHCFGLLDGECLELALLVDSAPAARPTRSVVLRTYQRMARSDARMTLSEVPAAQEPSVVLLRRLRGTLVIEVYYLAGARSRAEG